VALYKGTVYSTLADWKGQGFDSASADGFNPATLWVSNSDLHLTADPGNQFSGIPIGVTVDYDGAARSVVVPYRGADERAAALSPPSSAARDWQMFQ
jgi:hypothetical protein